MADREKVAKGLECHYKYETLVFSGQVCEECPYNKDNGSETCIVSLFKEALELLKEYEPVKPIVESALVDAFKVYSCGNCQTVFHLWRQKYCAMCGRAVKWDDMGRL